MDSSLAYEGAGRGLGVAAVQALNAFATGGLVPDKTLLLRLAPAVALARQAGRGEGPDRLEREDLAFFARVAAAYDELAAAEPARVAVIDATRLPDAVLAAAVGALQPLLA